MSCEEPQESSLSRKESRVTREGRSEGKNIGSRFQADRSEAEAEGTQVTPNRTQAEAEGAQIAPKKTQAGTRDTQVAPNKAEAGTEGGASGDHRPTRAGDFTKHPKPKEHHRIGFFIPRLLP